MAVTGYPRQLPPPVQSFFLFGMRGVGKSTWARAAFPTAPRVDLLDEGRFQSYLRDPGLLARELARVPEGTWVVIDEVQRLPGFLNDVHRLIEDRRLRFALLGSSARKLKQAGTNLLAGRALKRLMFPLLPQELADDFELTRVLRHGSLPIAWQSSAPEETLAAYAQLYLREEVQAEALVRNLAGFARFLPVAALFHGQVLNLSGVARDAGVSRSTVAGYLDILCDTHLAWLLPAFEGRLRVKERKHPKLYWVDPGVVRAVRGDTGAPGASERGALLEGWVATLLRAYGEPGSALGRRHDGLFYWSPTSAPTEVDFVVQYGQRLAAIEVKARPTVSSRELTGLKAIADLSAVKRRIIVFLGERSLRTADGIDVLTITDFVRTLEQGALV